MNHGHAGKKLERNRNGRRALVKSLVEALVLHGKIHTTEARAKEIKSRIDRLVNYAKEAGAKNVSPVRRVAVLRLLRKRVTLSTLQHMMDASFLKQFESRTSGYARVVKLPPRRGDGACVAILEFVEPRKNEFLHV